MTRLVRQFLADDSGSTAIEYGLVALIMAIGIIGNLTTLKTNLLPIFSNVSSNLSN